MFPTFFFTWKKELYIIRYIYLYTFSELYLIVWFFFVEDVHIDVVTTHSNLDETPSSSKYEPDPIIPSKQIIKVPKNVLVNSSRSNIVLDNNNLSKMILTGSHCDSGSVVIQQSYNLSRQNDNNNNARNNNRNRNIVRNSQKPKYDIFYMIWYLWYINDIFIMIFFYV